MSTPTKPYFYCPQCGYDLRGQTVERCPECGFHYDQAALRDLLFKAFNAACDPYISACKVLAPAGVLALVPLLRPSMVVLVPLGLLFLLSPLLIEVWIVRARDPDWWNTESWPLWRFPGAISGLWVFLVISFSMADAATFLVGAGLFVGLAWTSILLLRHGDIIRTNQVLSLAPEHHEILQRASTTAWVLVCADAVMLALLL